MSHTPTSAVTIPVHCIEQYPGVSRDMIRVVLRAMKSEGLIESTGKGRSAKWRPAVAAN